MIFSDISDSNCRHEAHGAPKYNTCKEKNNQHFKVHIRSVIIKQIGIVCISPLHRYGLKYSFKLMFSIDEEMSKL